MAPAPNSQRPEPDGVRPAQPDVFYGEDDSVFQVVLHEPPAGGDPPEDFVQDLWERQQFERSGLSAVRGEPVTVLHPGRRNRDSGPDFTGALIRIDGVDWAGDVEVHVRSGQWNEHRHVDDRSYNSVVLHVALHPDVWSGSLARPDGSILPEIILYPRLKESVRRLIHAYHTRPAHPIACATHWSSVPEPLVRQWLDELSDRRLRARAREVRQLSEFGFDASQYLYERIFAALGYAKNSEPMLELARRLPLRFILSHIPPPDVEACFLGVAGLIPHPSDLLDADRATADYAVELRERFERLRLRHNLETMPRERWRFFRLRPANFPPIRIAQGAALVRPGGLLNKDPIERLRTRVLGPRPLKALRACFQINAGAFWLNHVRLEKASARSSAEIGRQRIDVILVNAVLPMLMRLAARTSDEQLEKAAARMMELIPPEEDEIVRIFRGLGIGPRSAKEAQGMHELYRFYCTRFRCLSCRIGQSFLGGDSA